MSATTATLPIDANSLDYLHAGQLDASLQSLSENESIHAKSMLPAFAEWLKSQKQSKGFPRAEAQAISLSDLNILFPYKVSYYATSAGWLCTTRRAVAANSEIPGVQARALEAASCWEGRTPAGALLAMLTERINTEEMRYGEMGNMVVLGRAVVA